MILKDLIIEKLKTEFPQLNLDISDYKGDLCLYFSKEHISHVCKFLKENEELLFILCEDICGVDWARRNNRFSVVYHIFSMKHNFRLRLKVDVDESELTVDTVSTVWKTANWHEREVYDMFGIKFNGHPDMRRMYMPEEFEYHPLRKDFPLMGIPNSLPLPKRDYD